MPRSTLLVGGARSGKSSLAQKLVAVAGQDVSVVVTAVAFDEEMAIRIDNHRRDRPAGWNTIEAPYELAAAVARTPDYHAVLVDCVTLWLSNILVGGASDAEVTRGCADLVEALSERRAQLIVVSNEVGLGLVPPDPLSRRFRDAQGRLNQTLAERLDRAFLIVAGQLVALQSPADVFPEIT